MLRPRQFSKQHDESEKDMMNHGRNQSIQDNEIETISTCQKEDLLTVVHEERIVAKT